MRDTEVNLIYPALESKDSEINPYYCVSPAEEQLDSLKYTDWITRPQG